MTKRAYAKPSLQRRDTLAAVTAGIVRISLVADNHV